MTTGIDSEKLVEGAKAVLKSNDLGHSTKPAPGLYPHQWNWDSCFIAIGISRYDVKRAAEEIRALLRGQWKNGLVPQIVFNPEGTGYFPGPDVWQSTRSPAAPRNVETSGITQPPILAIAVRAIYENAEDKDWARTFLAEVFPKVLLFHRFLYEERNPDGDGLVVVIHPWESGLDNSPPYLDAGSRVELTYKPNYERLDLLHVSAKNRPTNKDYDLFVWLLEQMRAVDWDQSRYLESATLQVQDVIFNSILCRANRDLVEIARQIGEDPGLVLSWDEQTTSAINGRLWDPQDGMYYSFDRVAGRLLKDDTLAGFLPLFGGVAPENRAQQLIEEHLANPKQFWPEGGFAIPTTALDSSWFNPENYWLGPVWVSTNWMVLHGLNEYGHQAMAQEVAQQTLALVGRSGYHEYFNPLTGAGYGTDSFGWTAALTIDLLESGIAGT